jgi:hypothetical protein
MNLGRLVYSLLFSGLLATGQTNGTIAGTVVDPRQMPIAGVQVVIVQMASGERREALTNGSGQYTFSFLPPGSYSLEFSFPGFSTVVEQATLNITERIAVDAALKLSVVPEKVEVVSSAAQLQTETSAAGRVVDGAVIRQLPLSTRNFTQLLSLTNGTSAPLNDAGALGRGTQIISSSGARTTSNAITIDGVDAINIHTNSATDNGVGSNGTIIPSPEAIQEFKVQTGLYDAQSGRSGGANIVLATKSGSNDLHASAFEFFRNTDLNANSFFFNATGTPRGVLNQNQYGGTLGGPLRRNRTFFFFSYQGTRQINGLAGSTSLRLPPIPLDRSLASLGNAFAGQTGSRGGPAIAADGSNINPVALALLNLKLPDGSYLIPSPQVAGSGVNYTQSIPSTFDEDQGIINLDHQFTDKNHLLFRGMIAAQPTFRSFTSTGANLPGFGSSQDFKSRLANLTDTHVFSGSLVNEARFGVSRVIGAVIPQSVVTLSSIGMNRFNSNYYPDIPMITVTGAFSVGYDVNGDQGVKPTTWHYGDTISWVRAKHNLRGGIEGRRYDDNYYSRNDDRGALTLPTMADFLLGLAGTPIAQGGNGTGFSNINTARVASGIPDGADRITDVGLFVQDDWKIASRLTLNVGLRWDYLGWPVDVFGRRGNFDYRLYQPPPDGGQTSAGFVQSSTTEHPLPGLPMVNPTLIDNSPDRNFAPRFGFAYRLAERLVMRGGYGIYYDRLSNQLGLLTSQSAPDYLRSTLTGTGNIASTLQNPFPVLPQQSQFPIVPILYAPPYTNDRPAIGLNSIDPHFRTPYIQQWGLNLQYQLLRETILEVGYVGTKGVALPDRRAINQALLASPDAPINGITTNTAANTPLRVPYIGFSPDGLLAEETAADSHYHSLQANLRQRFSHGLQYAVSYMFSKSIDDTSGGSTTIFSEITGDESRIWTSKGPSDFDRRHRFVANLSYEIPKWGWAIGSSVLGRLVNGWAIAGIVIAQSGAPFSVTDSTGAVFFGTTGSRANWAPGATLATAELSGSVESRLTKFFNTAAFTKAGNLFGNAGRNILRGPSQRNVDLSLSKAIPITEHLRGELRAEFFNAFNTANFASPNANISSSGFGTITSTVGNPRVVELALKLLF